MKTNTKKPAKSEYITRTQAVRHLQVSLADFRRLCILKGIFPREVTGKSKSKLTKGSTKPITAYNRKDIQYLLHEPLLRKFRDHKIFAKKLSRALGRGDVSDARRIDSNRPRYTLDHVIKERYPTFVDALGDLDDALSTIFLFAAMPATDKVSYRVTQDAERLSNEWMAYVAREKLLRKVFVSIKGVYYSAKIHGQDVVWLVPFRFTQNIPTDVDFRIMLTFLEFYTTVIHFVLFRLYTDAGLSYPPPIDSRKAGGVGGVRAYILESQDANPAVPEIEISKETKPKAKTAKKLSLDKALAADKDNEEDEAEDNEFEGENGLDEFETQHGEDTVDTLLQPAATGSDSLLSKFVFFVGREVPLDIVEFIILASGGRVVSESSLDELIDNEDEKFVVDEEAIERQRQRLVAGVTHHVSDRPVISHKVPGRIYIQPQWLFDSLNKNEILPVGPYAPGEKLPPHLSPWGDRGNYNPEEEVVRAEDIEDSDSEYADETAEIEDEEVDAESAEAEQEQRDLQREAAGVQFSAAQDKHRAEDGKKRRAPPKPKQTPEQEEKELRKMMMTNKQKKLYDRMQYGNDKREARDEALRKKRRKVDASKPKTKKA